MTIQSTAFVPTTQAIRGRNRADQQRQYAITNVMERLDVYGVMAFMQPTVAASDDVRRQTATGIVDAVIAELRGGSFE